MQIILTQEATDKIRAYTQSINEEISGMGKASFDTMTNTWTVTDFKIFEQEVTGGSATLEGEDIVKFAMDMTAKGESIAQWCVWWHSHATMTVFWSATDTGTMDGNPFSSPYMLSIVTNHKSDYKARLDIYEPCHLMVDNIAVQETIAINPDVLKMAEEEIKLKIKDKPVVTTLASTNPYYANGYPRTKTSMYDDYYDRDIRYGKDYNNYYGLDSNGSEVEYDNIADIKTEKDLDNYLLQVDTAALDMIEKDIEQGISYNELIEEYSDLEEYFIESGQTKMGDYVNRALEMLELYQLPLDLKEKLEYNDIVATTKKEKFDATIEEIAKENTNLLTTEAHE